jgi:hypothetical protein
MNGLNYLLLLDVILGTAFFTLWTSGIGISVGLFHQEIDSAQTSVNSMPNVYRYQNAGESLYGYITNNNDGDFELNLIHPQSLSVRSFPLSIESEYTSLVNTYPSPNGRWLVMELIGENSLTRYFYITDLSSYSTRLIGKYRVTLFSETFTTPEAIVTWSPTSDYFVIRGSEDAATSASDFDDSDMDVYVYSVISESITNLTSDEAQQYSLGWSNDGEQIAVIAEVCTIECEPYLQIWNVLTGTKVHDYSLSNPVSTFSPLFSVACRIQWSPDNHYLSFLSRCDPIEGSIYEVFLYDYIEGDTTKVTNFTVSAGNSVQDLMFAARYAITWADDDTLLVGTTVAELTSEFTLRHDQTYRYAVNQGNLAISNTSGVIEWEQNPNSNIFATAIATFDTDSVQFHEGEIRIVSVTSSEIVPLFSAPFGCKLSWSSDGQWLAYQKAAPPTNIAAPCEVTFPRQLVFIHNDTCSIAEYNLPDRAILVGWIVNDI